MTGLWIVPCATSKAIFVDMAYSDEVLLVSILRVWTITPEIDEVQARMFGLDIPNNRMSFMAYRGMPRMAWAPPVILYFRIRVAMSFEISCFSLYDFDALYLSLMARKMADPNSRAFRTPPLPCFLSLFTSFSGVVMGTFIFIRCSLFLYLSALLRWTSRSFSRACTLLESLLRSLRIFFRPRSFWREPCAFSIGAAAGAASSGLSGGVFIVACSILSCSSCFLALEATCEVGHFFFCCLLLLSESSAFLFLFAWYRSLSFFLNSSYLSGFCRNFCMCRRCLSRPPVPLPFRLLLVSPMLWKKCYVSHAGLTGHIIIADTLSNVFVCVCAWCGHANVSACVFIGMLGLRERGREGSAGNGETLHCLRT